MKQIQIRKFFYQIGKVLQATWRQVIVISHTNEIAARSVAQADVPVINHIFRSTIFLILKIANARIVVLTHDTIKVIRRCIINNHHFIILVGLGQHAINSLFQVPILVGWNCYAEFDLFCHLSFLLGKGTKYFSIHNSFFEKKRQSRAHNS